MSQRTPLLFGDEPDIYHKINQAEVESAFYVKPNAGQTWTIRKGDGSQAEVKIVAVANNSPGSPMEPMIVFRNSRKELFSWPMRDWADADTLFKGN